MTNKTAKSLAAHLLAIKAIELNPENPFTWASGWKSPIYCDNRKVLSFPKIRQDVKTWLAEAIKSNYDNCDFIAGVATAGIPHATLLADALNLPMIYVRSSAKSHGRKNQIEGDISQGSKCIVVEDLISTGGSALKAVEALKEEGLEVLAVVSLFNYGFEAAKENFKNARVPFYSLSSFKDLLEVAREKNLFSSEQLENIANWRLDPANWS